MRRPGGLAVAVATLAGALTGALTAGLTTATGAVAATPRSAAGPAAAPSAATVTTYTGTPTVAILVRRAAAGAGPSAVGPRRPRVQVDRHYPRPAASPAHRSTGAAAPSAAGSFGTLLHSIDGVSSRDSQVSNFNATFEPPDQGLCEGAGFVVEPVNSAYRIYRTNGTSVRGPFNVNDLFNVGAREFTSDPRCWYDPTVHTWFATILFLNDAQTAGSLLVAVNPQEDPTGPWTTYQIDTTDRGGPGCPCFGDQPRLGIDATNLYVTTDEYSINGPQYNGGQVYAISKADLVGRFPRLHVVHFGGLHLGGALSGAPQPALTTGSSDAEYFLSALDPNGDGDNRVGVWAMTDRGAVATGGRPVLSATVIGSEGYATPPAASQKGSNSMLDPGDDRMQQVEHVGGTLWGELTTAVLPSGDNQLEAGGAWFQVRPHLSGTRIGGASIVRQGYVAVPRADVLYPAVQPDAAGRAAMVFTLTGPGRYPSAAYAVLHSTAAAFGAPVVAGAGTGPYDPMSTRWGDYSFAVPDLSRDAAWLATEYVPPVASQTSTRASNWGSRVVEVALS